MVPGLPFLSGTLDSTEQPLRSLSAGISPVDTSGRELTDLEYDPEQDSLGGSDAVPEPDGWELAVTGAIERPVGLSLVYLAALPSMSLVADNWRQITE